MLSLCYISGESLRVIETPLYGEIVPATAFCYTSSKSLRVIETFDMATGQKDGVGVTLVVRA